MSDQPVTTNEADGTAAEAQPDTTSGIGYRRPYHRTKLILEGLGVFALAGAACLIAFTLIIVPVGHVLIFNLDVLWTVFAEERNATGNWGIYLMFLGCIAVYLMSVFPFGYIVQRYVNNPDSSSGRKFTLFTLFTLALLAGCALDFIVMKALYLLYELAALPAQMTVEITPM
ncbi:MAG TPA: hypothetical protein VD735_03635 [Candidatus Saccharimonadales bacterium]|nr:hypothetical protein [Candidatus Saccharimonadales bacterium]